MSAYMCYRVDTSLEVDNAFNKIMQGDGAHVARVQLTQRLMNPFWLTGWTPYMAIRSANEFDSFKVEGNVVDYDASIIDFAISKEATEEVGTITCEVYLKGVNGESITFRSFKIGINPSFAYQYGVIN